MSSEIEIVAQVTSELKPNDVAYFAYGSLVNRHTRPMHTRAQPARLNGWLRQWKHCMDTPSGKACALTAVPRVGSQIEGVLVLDRRDKLAEVDRRETGYKRERIVLQQSDIAVPITELETYIYVSTGDHNRWGTTEYPIWLSYVDCILAGCIDVWGRAGAERFIASTEGWQAPLLDDRAAPRYPRALALEETTRQVIDGLLKENGIIRSRF